MIVRDIDYSQKILNEIAKLKNTEIRIGFFGDKDAHMVMVAAVNEFGAFISVDSEKRKKALAYLFAKMKEAGISVKKGAGNGSKAITIPERPFFRNAMDDENNGKAAIAKGVEAYNKTGDFMSIPYAIGSSFVAAVQASIRSGISPANHPYTVAAKGSNKPLVDSGRLGQSVIFKVIT
jgi:hypothetical protein